MKNLYLKWARLKGSLSPECQQLNRLFSQCVDGNRIRVPQNLEDPPEPSDTTPPFVLDILHAAAMEIIEVATKSHVGYMDYLIDAMDMLLNRDSIAVSEFELIQMTLRWCAKNNAAFSHFTSFFNFGLLSDEQQTWLLATVPLSKDLPGLVRNGLLQSQLLDPAELARFKLDYHGLHWKSVFSSTSDRMGHFLNAACRSLELFHKKLIILQADERLTLAIYIRRRFRRRAKWKLTQACASSRFLVLRAINQRAIRCRLQRPLLNYIMIQLPFSSMS